MDQPVAAKSSKIVASRRPQRFLLLVAKVQYYSTSTSNPLLVTLFIGDQYAIRLHAEFRGSFINAALVRANDWSHS